MKSSWIFQANPDIFDIDAYLNSNTEVTWLVRQEYLRSKMSVGDTVYIWKSAGKKRGESGIIASATISSEPSLREDDETSKALWKDKQNETMTWRVGLRIGRIANKKELIDRNWMIDDPILYDLGILKMSQNTNYLLPNKHAQRIRSLWTNTGIDWTYRESLAGLWVYAQLHNRPVSKTRDSLVAKMAVRIGRAVSGMYSKVQNFVSLDPRVPRTGLDAASQMDKRVWNDFWDPASQSIKELELQRMFALEWDNLFESDGYEDAFLSINPSLIKASSNIGISDKPRIRNQGQGFNRDSRVTKAIEIQAVSLTIENYVQRGYSVKDTGNTESYDLAVEKDNEKRRVEVKGTTTEGVSIILTVAEVTHAQLGSIPVDLAIVRQIEVIRSPDGPQAIGGKLEIIENWKPEEKNLSVATYTYKLR
jgi:hypothetical protein